MVNTDYDVIVIGGGAIGENVADRAVQGGMRTLLVESELVGGECSYWACMPSKALLRSSTALASAARVGGAAEAVGGGVDVQAVLHRRDAFTSHWHDDGQEDWAVSAGIELMRGHAVITGVREVTVEAPTDAEPGPASPRPLHRGGRGAGAPAVLRARHAVAICTGSVPRLPDIPGLAEAEPWSSRDATSADTVPGTLGIVGGGAVAVEMATAYAALGTTVHLISRGPLLRRAEPFVSEMVARSLAEAGVLLHRGRSPREVHRTAEHTVATRLDDGTELITDELLVATGRVPRLGDVGLSHVGLPDEGPLEVDDSMLVRPQHSPEAARALAGDWLYAVGDAAGRVLLTHQGKYEARIAGDAIAARAHGLSVSTGPWETCAATADHTAVPQVVFSDPEAAWVGLTAEQALAEGRPVRVVDYDLGAVAGSALHADGYRGQARMVVDDDREILLGVTFCGPDVAEMLHAATVAVVGEVPIPRLWHAVPAYPTMNEVWLRLLEAYGRPPVSRPAGEASGRNG